MSLLTSLFLWFILAVQTRLFTWWREKIRSCSERDNACKTVCRSFSTRRIMTVSHICITSKILRPLPRDQIMDTLPPIPSPIGRRRNYSMDWRIVFFSLRNNALPYLKFALVIHSNTPSVRQKIINRGVKHSKNPHKKSTDLQRTNMLKFKYTKI